MRTSKILRKIALDMRRAPPVCHVPSLSIHVRGSYKCTGIRSTPDRGALNMRCVFSECCTPGGIYSVFGGGGERGCQWHPRRKRLDEIALNVRGSCTGIIQVYRHRSAPDRGGISKIKGDRKCVVKKNAVCFTRPKRINVPRKTK